MISLSLSLYIYIYIYIGVVACRRRWLGTFVSRRGGETKKRACKHDRGLLFQSTVSCQHVCIFNYIIFYYIIFYSILLYSMI